MTFHIVIRQKDLIARNWGILKTSVWHNMFLKCLKGVNSKGIIILHMAVVVWSIYPLVIKYCRPQSIVDLLNSSVKRVSKGLASSDMLICVLQVVWWSQVCMWVSLRHHLSPPTRSPSIVYSPCVALVRFSVHSLSGNKNSYWQVLCLAPLVQPSFTVFIYLSSK